MTTALSPVCVNKRKRADEPSRVFLLEASDEQGCQRASHAQQVRFVVRDASEVAHKKVHTEGCQAEGSCFLKAEGSLKAPIVLAGISWVVRSPFGVHVLPVCSVEVCFARF